MMCACVHYICMNVHIRCIFLFIITSTYFSSNFLKICSEEKNKFCTNVNKNLKTAAKSVLFYLTCLLFISLLALYHTIISSCRGYECRVLQNDLYVILSHTMSVTVLMTTQTGDKHHHPLPVTNFKENSFHHIYRVLQK
jgi:hypothetical protein